MQSYPKWHPCFKAAAWACLILAAGSGAAADKSHPAGTVPAASKAASNTASGAAGSTAAGFTVGDVVARGGRQLTALEMKTFIPGTQWYTSIVGKPYVLTVAPDGTWKGEAGRLPQFLGSWRIDDQGRYCSRLTSRSGVAVTAEESCLHYYRIGDDYFASASAAPDSEAIPQRLLE